jgi:acyl-CoA thioester hydrolase
MSAAEATEDFDPTSPESYNFWATEHVRFADLDMLGHVNNKAYATYYETARVAAMAACNLTDGIAVGMAMIRLEIDYRKEIRFPAELRLGVRLRKLGNSSLALACAIFNRDVCASTSYSIAVRFDPKTRASKPFTEEERGLIGAYL